MSDCIFCKIVAGELPSFKVYEDDKTFAFLDINPINSGHVLVIPKVHATNIFEVSADDWRAVSETVHKLSPIVDRALEADGVNVLMNNRESAGQVIHHAHVHIIPRFKGDGHKIWPHRPLKKGEGDEMSQKIREAL